MHQTNKIIPFSHIQDRKNNLYAVRCVDHTNENIHVKLLYEYKNGYYEKHKESIHLDYDKYHPILSKNDVVKIWCPKKIDADICKKHIILKNIYSLLKQDNIVIYLTGSRSMGIENKNSDWDIIIKCDNPKECYSYILNKIPRLRKYTKNELYERAERYCYPNSKYSVNELFNIFDKTCTYTKFEGVDIGLFFIKTFENIWIKGDKQITSIKNCKILSSHSDTYSMPRILTIVNEFNVKQKILFTDWVLYGIENIKCEKIDLFNLWEVDENIYTLDGAEGYVKFY